MIKITIPGKPIAKKRPRFARRGKFVKTYSSQKKEKETTQGIIRGQYVLNPLSGPLSVEIYFGMPIPMSYSKKLKAAILDGLVRHTKNCDVDNLVKFYFDCMNGIVYQDDRQIFRVVAEKSYDLDPRTEIRIFDETDFVDMDIKRGLS